MPNNKAKEIGEKIALVLKAWKDVCPAKSFAGMTLVQFTATVQPSIDARAKIGELEDDMTVAETDRDNADAASMPAVKLVINAVKGDPTEGEDGEMYATMGYVRESDRKSGLTRKNKSTTTTATKP